MECPLFSVNRMAYGVLISVGARANMLLAVKAILDMDAGSHLDEKSNYPRQWCNQIETGDSPKLGPVTKQAGNIDSIWQMFVKISELCVCARLFAVKSLPVEVLLRPSLIDCLVGGGGASSPKRIWVSPVARMPVSLLSSFSTMRSLFSNILLTVSEKCAVCNKCNGFLQWTWFVLCSCQIISKQMWNQITNSNVYHSIWINESLLDVMKYTKPASELLIQTQYYNFRFCITQIFKVSSRTCCVQKYSNLQQMLWHFPY